MPTVYHEEEQDVYGELVVMRRRIDDLERSARRWPISFKDGVVDVTGDFAVSGDFSVTGLATFLTDSLDVAGGPVRAIAVESFGASASNFSLTTTIAEVISIDLTPPSWAEEMLLTVNTRVQYSSSGNTNLATTYSLDSGTTFDGAEASMPTGLTHVITNPTTVVETAAGLSIPDAFSIDFNAILTVGTNSSNNFRMDGHVFWLRAA